MCSFLTGVYAGVELRSYSIAARALRILVVDATRQQLSPSPSKQLISLKPAKVPDPPLADANEGISEVTVDLSALLKHVQRSSSL
jgi:hypothetical protein